MNELFFILVGYLSGSILYAYLLKDFFRSGWLHIFWIQEDGCLHLFSVHLLQGMRFPCFIRNVAEKPSQFLLEYYWDCCRDTARCCFSSSFICYFLF